MNASTETPWLVGIPGAPIVPPSWNSVPIWQAQIYEFDSRGNETTRTVISSQAAVWQSSRSSRRRLDLLPSAASIAQAISAISPAWVNGAIVSTPSDDFLVEEIPLLVSTRKILQEMNFDATAPIGAIAEVQKRDFLAVPGGAAALLDLTVAVEQWWPKRLYSPIWRVKQAALLEQVARAIVEEYAWLLGGSMEDVWVEAMLARQSWGLPKATLQEIGDQVGVTRERVRQVLSRFDSLVGQRIWPTPVVLADVVTSIANQNPGSVPRTIQRSGFGVDDDWTAAEIAMLLEWFGHKPLAEILRRQWDAEREAVQVTDDVVEAIRSTRSPLGFLNASAVLSSTGAPLHLERVVEAAAQLYSRCFRHNNWLLVGRREKTMAEGTLARQFSVTREQSIDEIVDGLERRRRARQADQLPPTEVLIELLTKSGSLEARDEFWTGPESPAEPGSIEDWLIKTIDHAEGEVLHRDVIIRQAQKYGLNIVSLHQFLSYSPVVRNIEGTALYRLVGRMVDAAAADFAARVADALRTDTEYEWHQFDPDTIKLSIRVGTGLYASSILNVDSALTSLWPADGAEIKCLCGRNFQGRVSRYGLGHQLIGWMTLLTHLNQEHDFHEGDSLIVEVRKDVLKVAEIT